MTGKLEISYELEKIDPDLPRDDVESFVEYTMRGVVTISYGDQSARIPPCGLLRVSRSLVRLCTFPVLYGEEAHESVLEYAIDFCSVYKDGRLLIDIENLHDSQGRMKLSLLVEEAQKIMGDFHRSVLFDMFKRCPNLLNENQLMLQIPDAFPLSFLARFEMAEK